MAFRYGNREQAELFPASIEDYVFPDDPVRVYDGFVEALDLASLGFDMREDRVGNSCYDPSAMLKLLLYGYSYGFRSSRKLERALYHNVSFMWLMGGLKPDYKTIAEFRRRYRGELGQVLRRCARLCLKMGLVEGNSLFVDGTKLRANASIRHTWDRKGCVKALAQLDNRIEQLLNDCEDADEAESEEGSHIRLSQEVEKQAPLREEIKKAMQELESGDRTSVNTTDPDCAFTKSTHGSYPGYNGQIVVDKSGLIVHSEAVHDNNDQRQLAEQIEKGTAALGKRCSHAVADAGYTNMSDVNRLEQQGISALVPLKDNKKRQEGFRYDSSNDTYICPMGHRMNLHQVRAERNQKEYGISGKICRKCSLFGVCTNAKHGRRIKRSMFAELADRIASRMQETWAKDLAALRKVKAERPFAHFRRNMGFNTFNLRSRLGACAELALVSLAHNLTRMRSMLGHEKLLTKLAQIAA